MALKKILTAKNAIKQINLDTLAYKVKCKWENQAKKQNWDWGEGRNEVVCGTDRLQIKWIRQELLKS